MDSRVLYLEPIAGESIEPLMCALNKLSFPLKTTGRFVGRRALCFLNTYNTNAKCVAKASAGRKKPHINQMLLDLRNQITDLPLEYCIVNRNTQCVPHHDKKNTGPSVIVSFGHYDGGKLIIEGVEHDAFLQPIQFDGRVLKHWNTPHTGLKYSVVYFTPSAAANSPHLSDNEYIFQLEKKAEVIKESKKRKKNALLL